MRLVDYKGYFAPKNHRQQDRKNEVKVLSEDERIKNAFSSAERKYRQAITHFIKIARETGLSNDKLTPISKLQFTEYIKRVREEVGDVLLIESSNMILAASQMSHEDMNKYMVRFDTIRTLLLEAVYNSTILVRVKESGFRGGIGKTTNDIANLFGTSIKGGSKSGMN